MSNVTLKNTKDQIYAAYQEALDKVKQMKEGKTSAADTVKAKEIKEVKAKAKEIVDLDILNDDMKDKYSALLKTLDLLEKEIEELYDIKKEADTLEALINAHKDKTRELNEKYAKDLTELNKSYGESEDELIAIKHKIVDDNNKLKSDLLLAYKEEKAKLERERVRENEEYKYELARTKKKDNDAWEEDKAIREKALRIKVSETNAELDAREEAIEARELIVDAKDKEINRLTIDIEELEASRKDDIDEATKTGKDKAAKEYAIQKSYIEKEAKWDKERLSDRIANLEKELATEKRSHELTLAKLDTAYGQIQEIATKTVTANNMRVVEKSN